MAAGVIVLVILAEAALVWAIARQASKVKGEDGKRREPKYYD